MTKDGADHQEVEHQERWIASVMPYEDLPSTAHLKMRVEIEANERWLASKLNASEAIPSKIRTLVQLEADRRRKGSRLRGVRKLAVAALGMAAVLGFFYVGTLREVTDAQEVVAGIELVVDAPEDEQIDVDLDQALSEAEALLASLNETNWDDFSDGL